MKKPFFVLLLIINIQAEPVNPCVIPTNAVDWSRMTRLYDYTNGPIDKTNEAGRPIISNFRTQPNWTLLVHTPEPCPPLYTNTVENTNLFSPQDQLFVKQFLDKFATFKNGARENERSKSGDGYDVSYGPDCVWPPPELTDVSGAGRRDGRAVWVGGPSIHYKSFLFIQQVKHNKLDGLRIELYGGQPVSLMHFKADEAVGDWLDWGTNGTLRFHARFDKPYLFWDVEHWTGMVPKQ